MRHNVLVLAIAMVLGAACSSTAASSMNGTTAGATASTPAETASTATPASVPNSAPASTTPYTSAIYADPTHWICRGDTPNDVCHTAYPITLVAADGSLTINPSRLPPIRRRTFSICIRPAATMPRRTAT